jgi:hypothetical protein
LFDTRKEHSHLANGYVSFFFLYQKIYPKRIISKISDFRATPTNYTIIRRTKAVYVPVERNIGIASVSVSMKLCANLHMYSKHADCH